MTVASTESDGGWGQVRGTKLLPKISSHHTGGGAFVYDTLLNSGVSYGDWYLKGNQGRKGMISHFFNVKENQTIVRGIHGA